jgi:hypothetical protein
MDYCDWRIILDFDKLRMNYGGLLMDYGGSDKGHGRLIMDDGGSNMA